MLEKVDYDEQGQRSAVYTYQQNWPATTPLLRTASDPNYRGAVKAVEYEYWKETNVHGMIRHEKNPVTGTTLASLDGVSSHTNKVIYPNGRTHTVEHNSLRTGFVSKRTDSLGRVTSFTYGAGGYGFLASKTDPLGRVTAYTRTSRGNLLTETLPDGSVRRWTRDALDRVLSHTDEHGHVTTYTRDAQGRATRIDYPDQSFEAFTYDPAFGLIATHTLRNGGVESFTYEDGLKTSHTDPLGNVTIFTYDAQRRLASVTDARGNTTTFAYGFDDKPTTTTYADGSSVINAYDAWGRRVSTTNELGNTWTYAHDEFGRVIAVTDPLGRTTRYSYAIGPAACGSCHADEKPTQITLPSGKIVKIDYDNEWRKVSETVGFGSGEAATTLYGYDAGNRLVTVTDPRGKVTTYTYDARDRRLSATDPLGNKTEWIHNDAAHTLTEKRPDGGLIVTQYDVMDRVASTTDPKGQTTQFAYGGTGAQGNKGDNLVMLTDARGNSYGFAYDLLNRKTTMIYPDNSQESWAYDLVGNMVTYTTRAGQVQTCTYDSRNRDTLCDWSDTTPDVSKSYDAAGRLLTMNSSVSHLTYTYDAANQLTSETQHIQGDGAAKTLSYTYDADGNRASLTYPGNTVATYTYTARNQLDTITYDGPPPLVDYTYDLNGNRTLKTIENGTSAIYTYDAANRLTSLDHRRGAESFARYDYTLNNVGNRTSRTETIHGTSTSDLYGYDPTDQVTQVRYNAAGAQHDRQVNYNYDPAGNRITVTDTAAQTPANYGTANNLNQYTVVDGGGLTYDANGNVTSHSGASYQYDAQNRLVSGTSRGNAFQFAYDPRDRCVKRTINGVVTFYTYDGWSLIQEYNVGDTEQKRYVHGAQIDEIIALINPFGTHFYHHDALGSVVGITAASGNMQEMYGYDIFGTPEIRDLTGLPIPQSALENRFMLTGREWIREVNLYDYRNRYYSSNLGRFLQTDPSRLRFTAVNLYRYVLNAPTMLDDPTGLEPIVLPPKPPIIKPPVTPKPPGPAALCVLAFEIGFAIGNAIGEGPAGDWLADQICECFTKDEEECRQRCYDQAERDYERCRQIPEWDTRARERCWRRAAEDLADCVHDC